MASGRTWRASQHPALSSTWVCFSDVSGKWGQPLNLAPLCSELQRNPQKHRARPPEMTNPRQLAQPSPTRVLVGAVTTPAYSSGHGRTHPHMHTRSHGWLHLTESWSNLIFHSFATMATIEEPVTCLNLCRHPVTGSLGIVFHTFSTQLNYLDMFEWTLVLRFYNYIYIESLFLLEILKNTFRLSFVPQGDNVSPKLDLLKQSCLKCLFAFLVFMWIPSLSKWDCICRISGEISPLRLWFELVRLALFQCFCCCPPAVCVAIASFLSQLFPQSISTDTQPNLLRWNDVMLNTFSCFLPVFFFSAACLVNAVTLSVWKYTIIVCLCEDITENVQQPSLLWMYFDLAQVKDKIRRQEELNPKWCRQQGGTLKLYHVLAYSTLAFSLALRYSIEGCCT